MPKAKTKKKNTVKKTVKKKIVKKAKKTLKPKKISRKKFLGKRIPVKTAVTRLPEHIYGLSAAINSDLAEIQSVAASIPTAPVEPAKEVVKDYSADLALVFDEDIFEDNNVDNEEEIEEELPGEVIEEDSAEEEYESQGFLNRLTEAQKHLIAYVSISCIMVVIVSFWVVGIKNSLGLDFKTSLEQTSQGEVADDADLVNAVQAVGGTIDEVKNQVINTRMGFTDFLQQAEQIAEEARLKNEIAGKIKAQLENLNVAPVNSNLNVNVK